jgi:hypothetical protein
VSGTGEQVRFDLAAAVERERALLPKAVFDLPSMLSYEERALLHWATREGFRPTAATIDLGCYLGGSTLPLALGLARREEALPASERPAEPFGVHSYDLFVIGGEWERQYFAEGEDFEVGASLRPKFERNIVPVRSRVTIHEGDVHRERWTGGGISTLFVDIAKSWSTHDHVVSEFFGDLLPDSLVIQQDLVHFGHPWCAIAMELLEDHFEFLGHVWFGSAVYRTRSAPPADSLPTRLLERLSAGEALALVDRCAERIGEPFAGQVRLAGAGALACYGEFDRARERVADVQASYDDDRVPFISQGFEQMPRWIDDVESGAAVVS